MCNSRQEGPQLEWLRKALVKHLLCRLCSLVLHRSRALKGLPPSLHFLFDICTPVSSQSAEKRSTLLTPLSTVPSTLGPSSFRPRQASYLRISPHTVLQMIMYLEPAHVHWMTVQRATCSLYGAH
jgi:hypothetical protein